MKVVEYDRLARDRAAEYPLDWTVSRMCPSCQSGTPQASSYEPKAVWVRPRPCEGHSTKPSIRAYHAYLLYEACEIRLVLSTYSSTNKYSQYLYNVKGCS